MAVAQSAIYNLPAVVGAGMWAPIHWLVGCPWASRLLTTFDQQIDTQARSADLGCVTVTLAYATGMHCPSQWTSCWTYLVNRHCAEMYRSGSARVITMGFRRSSRCMNGLLCLGSHVLADQLRLKPDNRIRISEDALRVVLSLVAGASRFAFYNECAFT